jgi:hypothetical protein
MPLDKIDIDRSGKIQIEDASEQEVGENICIQEKGSQQQH